ncbi:MAG TPA: ABC transporter permease subunit [Candidatus Limnocylindria bacterium]|nr:ABC transporter permease subunit [Candidatus Limnocylindria bacterium]
MKGRLFWQTLRWQRARLLVVSLAAFGWGVLIPVMYAAFSDAVRQLGRSGAIPEELLSFGSGSFFSVPGAMTLGFQHPFALAMLGIFAAGSSATVVAGERARGTLEVLLARPISRTSFYVTVLMALFVVVTIVLIALLAGMVAGAAMQDLSAEIQVDQLPLVVLNGFGMWAAFTTFGLAASVTFDRPGPAIGLSLAYLLVHYLMEVIGSLWSAAEFLQPYSLLHHFNPGAILSGEGDPLDLAIVFVAAALPVLYALLVFPRRDLAAPA